MFNIYLVKLSVFFITSLKTSGDCHGFASQNTEDTGFKVPTSLSDKNSTSSVFSETVDHLAKVIKEGLANASRYELPTSAKMYEPTDNKTAEYGSYDFVIIGGGNTGAVIARRLSETKKFTVLVLEAGRWPNFDFIQFPAYLYPSTLSEYNWGYKSVPQTTACLGMVDQRCVAPQGRGVGGTTLINGAIYNHADPTVFKKWSEISRDASWSYEKVLPLYKKSERFVHRNPWLPIEEDYHGTEGPLTVEQALPPDELTAVFLESNRKLGFKVSDQNGPYRQVASAFQTHTKNGRRQDTGTAFLTPVLSRRNLNVSTESFVTKIEIDRHTKVTKGVTFVRHGKTYFVEAKKEVILSAGVFSSPKILMLSGIGPKDHLRKKGIDVIEDLEVGSGLTDDVVSSALHFSSKLHIPIQTLKEQIEDYLHGIGPLTTAGLSQGVAWYKSSVNKDSDSSDFEIFCQTSTPSELEVKVTNWKPETYNTTWGNITNAIQMLPFLVNPHSRGSVRLKSNNPFDYPLIDFNFLSDVGNKDIAVIYEGIKLAFKLMETAPFRRLGVKYEQGPVSGCRDQKFLSKEYWYCFMRHTCSSGYHGTGTCSMGADPRKGAVVDSNLKVFGIQKLRVADASVFTTAVARPPDGTCIMIGEKLSEVIKTQYA